MIFRGLATKQERYSANSLETWAQVLAPWFNNYFTSQSISILIWKTDNTSLAETIRIKVGGGPDVVLASVWIRGGGRAQWVSNGFCWCRKLPLWPLPWSQKLPFLPVCPWRLSGCYPNAGAWISQIRQRNALPHFSCLVYIDSSVKSQIKHP